MKLTYDSQKDHKFIHAITHTYLQSRKGEELTGMKARQMYAGTFGMDIDHHEWINTLEYMTTIGEAKITQGFGDCKYFIK
jgi:hypothetical protein